MWLNCLRNESNQGSPTVRFSCFITMILLQEWNYSKRFFACLKMWRRNWMKCLLSVGTVRWNHCALTKKWRMSWLNCLIWTIVKELLDLFWWDKYFFNYFVDSFLVDIGFRKICKRTSTFLFTDNTIYANKRNTRFKYLPFHGQG